MVDVPIFLWLFPQVLTLWCFVCPAAITPALSNNNKVSPPSSSAVSSGAPVSRLEAELSRTHEPDNFLTNVTSRALPTSASGGSLGAPSVTAPQLDNDPLTTDLSFLLGDESNSPPPPVSSPAKQAPPAPPGATVCELSSIIALCVCAVSYTHLRAHET